MEFSTLRTFEVLLCHINNFFCFTLINVLWRDFDFSSYLSEFLSAHVRSHKPTNYKKESYKWNFFFIKFSLFLTKIFAFPFHNFLAKQIEANFAKKVKMFAFFVNKRNAQKFSAKFFFAINAKFLRNNFPFRWNPGYWWFSVSMG